MAVLAAVGGAAWLGVYERARIAAASPAGMLQRLPPREAMVLFVDLDTLRRGGLLKLLSAKTPEDPDYQTFVRATGFDYQTDLDRAAASFSNDGVYLVVKGRFDWNKLRAYAEAQGGRCQRGMCRMSGSTPERRISFFLLQSNLLALAVSTDGFAAAKLAEGTAGLVNPLDTPRDPVWLSIPAESLKSTDQLPAGTAPFRHGFGFGRQDSVVPGPTGRANGSETCSDLPELRGCRGACRAVATCNRIGAEPDRARKPETRSQRPNRGAHGGRVRAIRPPRHWALALAPGLSGVAGGWNALVDVLVSCQRHEIRKSAAGDHLLE